MKINKITKKAWCMRKTFGLWSGHEPKQNRIHQILILGFGSRPEPKKKVRIHSSIVVVLLNLTNKTLHKGKNIYG